MALGGASAKRFAEAALALAVEQDAVDAWRDSLVRVAAAVSGAGMRLLRAPSISLAARRRALAEAVAGEPPGVRALLAMLLQRGRIALLPDIVRAYQELLDARAGIEKAVITTAVPLDEAARRDLVARLERLSGKKLRATFTVEAAALGGVVVRIGDHQVDGSVRTRLALLREQLARGAS